MNGKNALTKNGLAYHRSKLQEATFTLGKYVDLASLSNCELAEVDDAEEERDIFDEYEVRETDDEVLLGEDESENYFLKNINCSTILEAGMGFAESFLFSHCSVRTTQTFGTVLLPMRFCQGQMNAGRGSSACVIISLLMGYMLAHTQDFTEHGLAEICSHIIPLYCGSIEIGNLIYDNSRL